MKLIKSISTIFILTCLTACEPAVTFTEPQPTKTDNLSNFPDRLQGHYISSGDGSMLHIGDKLIQRIYDMEQKIHTSQLSSDIRLSGDTMIDLTTNKKEMITRDGDSLVTHIHHVDTLFLMDYDNVVRKFKGYYFLNKRLNKESWEVKKMALSKGQLVVSSISTGQEIDNLTAITESVQDTVGVPKFAPSKKQFKALIKDDGFSDSEIFIRRKNYNPVEADL